MEMVVAIPSPGYRVMQDKSHEIIYGYAAGLISKGPPESGGRAVSGDIITGYVMGVAEITLQIGKRQ